jgi:hypothetical protein
VSLLARNSHVLLKRFSFFAHYRHRKTIVHRDINPGPSYDAFWIFLLWRALHGGDATMADIAAEVIANLSQYLPAHEDSFGVAPLPPSSQFLALCEIEESESPEDDPHEAEPDLASIGQPLALFCSDPREFSIYHNYFNFKGVFYRVERPAFACLPTAA